MLVSSVLQKKCLSAFGGEVTSTNTTITFYLSEASLAVAAAAADRWTAARESESANASASGNARGSERGDAAKETGGIGMTPT